MKKIPIGALMLIMLWVSVHGAFAYTWFYLEGTAHLDVVAPYVQFYRWSDGLKRNQFDLTVSMVPEQWTIIDNATYGIINTKSGPQECGFFVESIDIVVGQPENFTVQIFNATDIKATWTTDDWTNLGEINEVPFTMYANEKASLKIMVLASTDAVDCDVVFKLRVPPEGT